MNNLVLAVMLKMLPLGVCAGVTAYVIIKVVTKKLILSIIIALSTLVVILIFPIKFGTKTCSNCNTELGILDSVCNTCGEYQDTWGLIGKMECPYCNNIIDTDSYKCIYCGSKLDN